MRLKVAGRNREPLQCQESAGSRPRGTAGPGSSPDGNPGPDALRGAMSMRASCGVRTAAALVAILGLLGVAASGGVGFAADVTLQGTGATFPAPLYQRWFTEYNKLHPEVQINCQALGSAAGVKQVHDGLVNCGPSGGA